MNDEYYMDKAIEMAKRAYVEGEIPVGAVIVEKNIIIAEAYNKKDSEKNVTRHAEIIAIEEASKKKGDWRLNDTVMYVTLEPCPMCASAIQQARIGKVVYGCESNINVNKKIIHTIMQEPEYNHYVEISSGIKAEECSQLLKDFFKEKR